MYIIKTLYICIKDIRISDIRNQHPSESCSKRYSTAYRYFHIPTPRFSLSRYFSVLKIKRLLYQDQTGFQPRATTSQPTIPSCFLSLVLPHSIFHHFPIVRFSLVSSISISLGVTFILSRTDPGAVRDRVKGVVVIEWAMETRARNERG